jgi:hypothetical protein
MSPHYRDTLDYEIGVRIVVEFTVRQREVLDYAVVLTVEHKGESAIVRSYDGAHGINEMHRHSRGGGKAAAAPFHAGTLGEGMRAAIVEVRTNYQEMIDAWRAT